MRPTKQPAWLAAYTPVCEAIAALLHPYGEVAVHDIASDRILAIWNPYSRRRPGDPSLLDGLGDLETANGMTGPYEKVGEQGQRLTSVSALLVDAEGQARGLLCVNFDRSPFDGVAKLVTEFAAAVTERPPELFSRDWREEISLLVDEECRRRGLRRDGLTRADRLALVGALDDKGLFATRNAVTHAAHTLGVSRATVYKLLKEARS